MADYKGYQGYALPDQMAQALQRDPRYSRSQATLAQALQAKPQTVPEALVRGLTGVLSARQGDRITGQYEQQAQEQAEARRRMAQALAGGDLQGAFAATSGVPGLDAEALKFGELGFESIAASKAEEAKAAREAAKPVAPTFHTYELGGEKVTVRSDKDPTTGQYVQTEVGRAPAVRAPAVGPTEFQRNVQFLVSQNYTPEEAIGITKGGGLSIETDPETGRIMSISTGGGRGGVKTTEAERKGAGFAQRMAAAEDRISEAVAIDPESERLGIGEKIVGSVAGESAANYMRGETRQLARQAQEDWVRAKLRLESGAVIGDQEMEREIQTYFPQPGDLAPVQEQKRQARLNAMRQVEIGAGNALPPAQAQPGIPSQGFGIAPNQEGAGIQSPDDLRARKEAEFEAKYGARP